MRIGVFGGTFDPLHNGHLMIALEVRYRFTLDRMLLVVANDPWQKSARAITPAAARLSMVVDEVARINDTMGAEVLEASDLEIRRGGATYSVDTLAELHAAEPGAELFLIVGSDAAAGLDTWKRTAEVQRLATTVVVDRGGREGGRPPADWDHVVLDVPLMEVSSSDIRDRVAQGAPVEAFLPPTVSDGIRRLGLYRPPA
ncbi:MAG: nicotinate-nucleotide adenylyltransferase [Acidimicrobiales bacterium]